MSYFVVEDFKFGMDRRRERVAGTPGTLWLGKNVHITRGADVERRKKFVPLYGVPGTFGAASIRSQIYVFGSADLAGSLPIGIQYQRLQSAPANMIRVLDVKTVSGKFYVIAEYDDGSIRHFYDGARVTDWDVIAAQSASFESVAAAIATRIESNSAVTALATGARVTITALVPGTGFTISASAVDGGVTNDQTATVTGIQTNVVEVVEVLSKATIEITGGTADPGENTIASLLINGVEILAAPVSWTASNASTAIKLATAINNGFTTHGYSAAAVSTIVTVSAAPGAGAAPNGFPVVVTLDGDVTVVAGATLASGVTAVAAQAQVTAIDFAGTFETADTFTVTVDGVEYKITGLASGTGRTIYVDKQRVWSPVGSLWFYSMLTRPDIWDPEHLPEIDDNDAGFINIASESEGNEELVVAARYQNLAAIFSQDNITLFLLDTDPANFAFQNNLENTGTTSPKSVVRYGNNDVFYLDPTGIRSLRARDSSNAPFVSDIGNAIDTFVQEYVDTLSKDTVAEAIAAIEPRDGRYWLILGGRIFVLSYFPGAKISAWTYYETDEFDGDRVQAVIRARGRVFVRAGDFIYAYGGADGATYPEDDEVVAEVEMPFLSAKTPATIKQLNGFDLAARNVWECEIAFDPNHPDKTINVGNVSKISFSNAETITIPGETTMVAPRLVCRKGGPATLSMFAIHYDEDAKG